MAKSLRCQFCSSERATVYRTEARPESIIRYRKCSGCGRKYATKEEFYYVQNDRQSHHQLKVNSVASKVLACVAGP